jgi:hypothetical protein
MVERHISYFELPVESLKPRGVAKERLTETISRATHDIVYNEDRLRYGILRDLRTGKSAIVLPFTGADGRGFFVSEPLTDAALETALQEAVNAYIESGFIPSSLFEFLHNQPLARNHPRD